MNEQPRPPQADTEPIAPELEARIVALVLGEASDFEAEQLSSLICQRPELATFQHEIEAVHQLLGKVVLEKGNAVAGVTGEVPPGESVCDDQEQELANWKLSAERRAAIVAVVETVANDKQVSESSAGEQAVTESPDAAAVKLDAAAAKLDKERILSERSFPPTDTIALDSAEPANDSKRLLSFASVAAALFLVGLVVSGAMLPSQLWQRSKQETAARLVPDDSTAAGGFVAPRITAPQPGSTVTSDAVLGETIDAEAPVPHFVTEADSDVVVPGRDFQAESATTLAAIQSTLQAQGHESLGPFSSGAEVSGTDTKRGLPATRAGVRLEAQGLDIHVGDSFAVPNGRPAPLDGVTTMSRGKAKTQDEAGRIVAGRSATRQLAKRSRELEHLEEVAAEAADTDFGQAEKEFRGVGQRFRSDAGISRSQSGVVGFDGLSRRAAPDSQPQPGSLDVVEGKLVELDRPPGRDDEADGRTSWGYGGGGYGGGGYGGGDWHADGEAFGGQLTGSSESRLTESAREASTAVPSTVTIAGGTTAEGTIAEGLDKRRASGRESRMPLGDLGGERGGAYEPVLAQVPRSLTREEEPQGVVRTAPQQEQSLSEFLYGERVSDLPQHEDSALGLQRGQQSGQPVAERLSAMAAEASRPTTDADAAVVGDKLGAAFGVAEQDSIGGRGSQGSPSGGGQESLASRRTADLYVADSAPQRSAESSRLLAENDPRLFRPNPNRALDRTLQRYERSAGSGPQQEAEAGPAQQLDQSRPLTLGKVFESAPRAIGEQIRSNVGGPTHVATRAVRFNEVAAAEEAYSTFSLHVSDVSFQLAQSALARGEWPDREKIRIEEFVNAFDYGDPMPSQKEKIACRLEQSIHPFLQQRNILRVALRSAAVGRSAETPLRLTLLLDNSGSMERPDRHATVLRALTLLTSQLRSTDRVTLISFARQPRLLAERVRGDQAGKFVQLAATLPSEGGTNFEAALQLALEKAKEQQDAAAQNRIIMLTDGAANLGDAQPESLSRRIAMMRSEGIAFDAGGISADGLNDEILEALSRQGDGRYYLLDSAEAADAGFARQIAGALRPAASNVKVQVEFNPNRVGSYRLLGFEKHRLHQNDFRNDQVDAAEMAAAEAGVAIYHFESKPDGEGDVGSVSVRFRDMSSGRMVENRWPIPYEPDAPRCDQAAPSVRLATVAALLAAKLVGDPLGDMVDLKTMANLTADLPQRMPQFQRVQQLQQMIEQTRQIGGP